MNLKEFDKQLFTDRPEVLKEYKKLEPRYEIIKQILKYRKKQKMSQNQLAQKIKTKQSCISRLENGDYNPSLEFLSKVASALGKELHISFK